jgi:DNA-directed RNA polymerase specialized sigma24 family protein
MRWIGLEEEAKRLEMALSTLPAGQRTALAGQGHSDIPSTNHDVCR